MNATPHYLASHRGGRMARALRAVLGDRADSERARAGVLAGLDMLQAGRSVEEACEVACQHVLASEQAAVRVAVESAAIRGRE